MRKWDLAKVHLPVMTFKVICIVPAPNSECNKAVEMHVNETVLAVFNQASFNPIYAPCNNGRVYSTLNYALWYKFKGTGTKDYIITAHIDDRS